MNKECTRCHKVKIETEFYRSGYKTDGTYKRNTFCKECHDACTRNNYNKAKDKIRRKILGYKISASRKLRYAVRMGRIEKLSCFLCGEKRVEGHHLSYDYPLKVVWLCHKHHNETHHGKI